MAVAVMVVPQHVTALARANEVRFRRAFVKQEVASGRMSVAVAMNDWGCQSMPVYELLLAQRRWGSCRARKFLEALPLSEAKRVEALSPRQCDLVLRALRRG